MADVGRKPITDEDKNVLVQKLAPHLQSGLSIRKACLEAKVPRSTIYFLMKEDESFLDQIERLQNFGQVVYSNVNFKMMLDINDKAEKAYKEQKPLELSKDERHFLMWLGENDKNLSERWGKKIQLTGKDDEPLFPMLTENADVLKAIMKSFEIMSNKLHAQEGEVVEEHSNGLQPIRQ